MRFEPGYTGDGFTEQAEEERAEQEACDRAVEGMPDCTCYHTCGEDSHSGHFHQHEDEPCPLHPNAPMVG